jgi:hypothetical protein
MRAKASAAVAPDYGKYPGELRLYADQVPYVMDPCGGKKSACPTGSTMNHVRGTHRLTTKQLASYQCTYRADGKQPPAACILDAMPSHGPKVLGDPKSKNILDHYEWVDTRMPQDGRIKKELSRYPKDVWVYFDCQHRASHAVLRDYMEDLKAWMAKETGGKEWVLGMDNLAEQTSDAYRCKNVLTRTHSSV